MGVTVRLRRKSRASAALLAIATLAGAASAALHTHAGNAVEGELGPAARVPVSVIANPDAPSSSEHLHAGSTYAAETCQACVLATAHGVAPTALVAPTAAPAVTVGVGTLLRPAAAVPTRQHSRSPPTSA